MHNRKILHRDLKVQNIFMTDDDTLKIGDLGISKQMTHTTQMAETPMIGTPLYLSPEIINSLPYSFKSDIWALGCILYQLCTLKVPFDAPNLPALSLMVVGQDPKPIAD